MILMLKGVRPSCSTEKAHYHRVVVLSPAVADVLHRLGADDVVVGKTKSVDLFPKAVAVGSHIRPNFEIVASLHPDLIIVSSERFFSKELVRRVGAHFYLYNPITLDEILVHVKRLGALLGKEKEALTLVNQLREKLKKVKQLKKRPKVVYEVMQTPYLLAGRKNIVVDIIERAGGRYLIASFKKFVRLSCERVRLLKPDIYIYQIGPMNPHPVAPEERACLKNMGFLSLRVNELEFARANTKSFDNVLFLNGFFARWDSE